VYGIIYKATGPSGLVYIGQTINSLAIRKAHHALRTKKGDRRTAFHIALLEHGFSAFQWEQIDTAETAEELDAKEKHWIAHYQSDNPAHGYNGTDGGIKTVYSPETRRKISEAKKGKPNGKKGKHHTPEHCRHISEANKGRVISEETRRKINDTLKGKGIKPPVKKGRIPWNKGKTGVYSEETRKKISEGLKRYYGARVALGV
jgi:group I intron endonuclease